MFNAEEYWANKLVKKWVVSLRKDTKSKHAFDIKLVVAATREGAIRTAKFHSKIDSPNRVSCRLATPQDLL